MKFFVRGEQKQMLTLLIICLCVCVVVCFCLWPSTSLGPSHVSTAHLDRRETIFVMMPELQSESVLDELFRRAYNPLRVFVGVGVACPLRPNVRCLDHKQPYGNSIARQEINRQLYRNEQFVLCLTRASQLCQDWDLHLVLNAKPRAVVCHWPSVAPSFPVFDSFIDCVPRFKASVVQSLFPVAFEIDVPTWDCLFGAYNELSWLFYPGLPYLKHREDDFVLCWLLYHKRLRVYNTNKAIVMNSGPKTHSADIDPKLRDFTLNVLKKIALQEGDDDSLFLQTFPFLEDGFGEYFGLDFKTQQGSGRARLGLFGEWNTNDILHRFGTMQNYQRAKIAVTT
jgi:hypothetical protein